MSTVDQGPRIIDRYDSTNPLNSEVVRGCYLSKLYFVLYKCNVGYSVLNYKVDAAFHTYFPNAQDYVESQRVQGSTFYIWEIAALAFPITDVSLVVTDISTNKPFERYQRGHPTSALVSDIAAFFDPRKSDTIQRFFVQGDIAIPVLPLLRFSSIPNGQNRELRWGKSTLNPKIQFAEATANRLNNWLIDKSSRGKRRQKTEMQYLRQF